MRRREDMEYDLRCLLDAQHNLTMAEINARQCGTETDYRKQRVARETVEAALEDFLTTHFVR